MACLPFHVAGHNKLDNGVALTDPEMVGRTDYPMGFLSRRRAAAVATAAFLAAFGTVAGPATPAQAAVTGAVVREGDFIFVPSFGTASGAAICNPGEVVIGGGVLVMSLDTTV